MRIVKSRVNRWEKRARRVNPGYARPDMRYPLSTPKSVSTREEGFVCRATPVRDFNKSLPQTGREIATGAAWEGKNKPIQTSGEPRKVY